MSYIANSLAPHEHLVMEARFPWLLRAASWGALFVLGLAPPIAWVVAALGGGGSPGLGIVAAACGLLGLVIFAWTQLYMIFTETGVTDQRFVIKRGIIARYVTDFPLNALENIDLNQSVVGRIFRYGRLNIAGAGETQLGTPPMQDPVTFRTAIAEARIALNDPPAYRARPVPIDPMRPMHDRAVDAAARPRHPGPARGRTAPSRQRPRRKGGPKGPLPETLR